MARELRDSYLAAIGSIDEIISAFRSLRYEMTEYEKRKNIAKTVGTSTTALGTIGFVTGVGLAFFTGGTSLLLTYGSLAATIGGAGVNTITNIVDLIESKGFYKQIDQLLVRYNSKLKSLEDIWNELHNVVEEVKKRYNLDDNAAWYAVLQTTSNGTKVYGVATQAYNATRLVQAASIINTLKTMGTVTQTATGGMKFVFASIETAGSLSRTQLSALSNVVKSDAILFTNTAGKALLQGGMAALSVALTIWEIKTLVDDWKGTHPTIQAVDKVVNELNKKKTSFQGNVKDLEPLITN